MRSGYSVLILVGVLMGHVPWLLLPSVNLEFAFVDAARYLAGGEPRLLEQFFHFQANSLGFPFLGRLALLALPWLDPLLGARLVSLSGVVLLWAGVRSLARQGQRPDADAVLLFVLLNPLVWTFSARATADLFPAGLAVFAVSVVLDEDPRLLRSVCGGLLLGVAAIIKFHALLLTLYIVVVLLGTRQTRQALATSAVVVALATSMVATYAWWAHQAFGFWLTPPLYQGVLRWAPSAAPHNFIGYAGYLVLLTGPLSLLLPGAAALLARHGRVVAIGVIVLFLLGATALDVQGELGLGPLDRFLNSRVMGGGFLVLLAAFLVPLAARVSEDVAATTRRRLLLLATLGILLALAMTRPAQRYLLFVLSLHVLALPVNMATMRRTMFATVMAFAAVNGFIGYAQWCSGTAARELTDRIEAAGLLSVTDPGDLASHVGNRFFQRASPDASSQPQYVVRVGQVAGAMMTVTRGVSLLPRSYSLVRLH